MTASPFPTFLLAGVLLTVPSGLRATERDVGFQKQLPQTVSPPPKKKGFFATLFGSKNRKDDGLQQAAVSPQPRSRMAAAVQKPHGATAKSAPLDASAATPTSTRDGGLPASPDLSGSLASENPRGNTQPRSRMVTTTSSHSTLMDAAVSVSPNGVPLPGTPGFSAAKVPEAEVVKAPELRFGQPVPGKPGMAYLPGMERIPANIVDVSGMTPGTKAQDPRTKIVFLVP